jgi:hypothetical protein
MSNHVPARRSPLFRFRRGLRRFLSDLREAWSDPGIPASAPTLNGYPINRP